MHGIIGQLAADPVRLVIAVVALIASIAIIRCLSGLAFFGPGSPREHDIQKRDAAQPKAGRGRFGPETTKPSTSTEE